MTFDAACKFCYDIFKEEDNSCIGSIKEYEKYWVFYKKCEVVEYGILPILVYKEDKHSILLTFDKLLELSEEMENSVELEVPSKYAV
jgi:hypothetical protein